MATSTKKTPAKTTGKAASKAAVKKTGGATKKTAGNFDIYAGLEQYFGFREFKGKSRNASH